MASPTLQQSSLVEKCLPQIIANLHKKRRQLGDTVSEYVDNLFDTIFDIVQDKCDHFRSMSYLQFLEILLRPKGFAFLQESAALLELTARLVGVCLYKKVSPCRQIEMLAQNEVFIQYCEEYLPNVTRWYKASTLAYTRSARNFSICRESFSKSPAFAGRNPIEAARIHSSEVAQGRWKFPPAKGKVRIHFFKQYPQSNNASRDQKRPKPDVRIDLDFDSRNGVNFWAAKEALGVESLAIITDRSPHRRVFDPVSQDRLSPVAAYDLSKNFTEPIRVFEPSVSSFTQTKRAIHEPLYLLCYSTLILFRSMLGFPLANPAYASVACGELFASQCNRMSRWLSPLNKWVCQGAWFIIQLVGCLVILPLVIFYHTAKGVKHASSWFITNLTAMKLTGVSSAIQINQQPASRGVPSLPCRGWLAFLTLGWLMIAGFKSSII